MNLNIETSNQGLRDRVFSAKHHKSWVSSNNHSSSTNNFRDLVKDNFLLGYLLPKYKNTKLEKSVKEDHTASQQINIENKLLDPRVAKRNRVQSSYVSRNHSMSNPNKSINWGKSSLTSEVSKKLLSYKALNPDTGEKKARSPCKILIQKHFLLK